MNNLEDGDKGGGQQVEDHRKGKKRCGKIDDCMHRVLFPDGKESRSHNYGSHYVKKRLFHISS